MMHLATRYRLQYGAKRPAEKTTPRLHEMVQKLMDYRRREAMDPPVDEYMRRGDMTRRFAYLDE